MTKAPTVSQQIIEEVTTWPGVVTGPGRRGELSFRVGGREIGHLHGDHSAHFGFPREVWAELRKQGRIAPHPVFPSSPGPAERRIENEADVRDVIELLRLNYDRPGGPRWSAGGGRDMTSLRGLRTAITGGTSGLGLALVETLRVRGAAVAFVARGAERVSDTARRYPGTHGISGDVSRKDEIHPIAMRITAALDGLDVLINNASSLGPVPLALLADTDCEDLEAALATNLVGPFRLTKALLGALAASARNGRPALVINIISDAAMTPYAGWGAYGASKAALLHLSRIWDEELREHGVRVKAIDPGDMDTPLHALAVPDADPATLKRPGDAAREIIASIEAFALQRQPSDESRHRAGATPA